MPNLPRIPAPRDLSWHEDAECARGYDPDDWFDGDNNYARYVCSLCSVSDRCLQDALAFEGRSHREYRYGIRGGLTPSARYEMARYG